MEGFGPSREEHQIKAFRRVFSIGLAVCECQKTIIEALGQQPSNRLFLIIGTLKEGVDESHKDAPDFEKLQKVVAMVEGFTNQPSTNNQ